MIHIVFNEVDLALMQEVITIDETLTGTVLQVKDDFAVGPINNLYAEEGTIARNNWWRLVLESGDLDGKVDSGEVNDLQTMDEIRNRLNADENEKVWIWVAQNKHDLSGYYWLLPYLKDYQGRIYILHLHNLPFINETGGIFYPEWLSKIPVKEFIKAKKLARLLTASEFEMDIDEWSRLAGEGKMVRLLEGGKKLIQYDESFYDGELKKFVPGNFQKAGKIIQQFLTKAKHTTGDMFLLWRLKEMVMDGILQSQGIGGKLKDLELRLPTQNDTIESVEESGTAAD